MSCVAQVVLNDVVMFRRRAPVRRIGGDNQLQAADPQPAEQQHAAGHRRGGS